MIPDEEPPKWKVVRGKDNNYNDDLLISMTTDETFDFFHGIHGSESEGLSDGDGGKGSKDGGDAKGKEEKQEAGAKEE